MYEESVTETGYAIICPKHGRVHLTKDEYNRQMDKPNSLWQCPRMDSDPEEPGLCGRASQFDDLTYEKNFLQGEESDD